jgi:M6 family metalloprotease-like protein
MTRLFSLPTRILLGAGILAVAAALPAAGGVAVPPPFAPVANEATSGGLFVQAKVFTNAGWVAPGETYPLILKYRATSAVVGATFSVTLHGASVFVSSSPAAVSGNGTSGSPLTYPIGALTPGQTGKIIIQARSKTLVEDPEVMWKDLSADVSVAVTGQSALPLRTHGPKVTTLQSARFGDRPFPLVMAQYQDVKHCTGVNAPYPGCTGNHTADALDAAINSRTSGNSLWQLYQDMSFGQLYPIGTVSPPMGSGTVPFTPGYTHKFSTLSPNGTCSGATIAAAHGTPGVYANRIENGWYLLPGNQGYYGSDSGGHGIAGLPVGSIDDGCGPTAKIVYDAASLADPDIDYNEYDTDKDGVVDFFNLMFAGCGGHGCLDVTGPNNIWPHKSDVRYYFTDANGVTGYVSNDPLKDHFDRPIYYTDATRKVFTLTATAFPVFVVVGPYNVNPEDAVEKVSVVGHEYGHSLGLPDFYNTTYEAMGSWELMGTDYFQYFTVYARSFLGWIVPRPLQSGTVTLRESKYDTGEIHWRRPDGTPYVLTGAGIHNADAWRLDLPTDLLIHDVPSGTHAWFSGAGNDFGCPPNAGHKLDVFLPDLQQYGSASAVTLTFKSLYEIEWDWDYAFVQVSDDGGVTWDTLPSANGTTFSNAYNPNNVECFAALNNGITGVFAGGGNTLANPNRAQALYPASPGDGFIDDEFDLTAYKGKPILLRFAYFTDPAAVQRGWFIDDIRITADSTVIYASDFEAGAEDNRLFSSGWQRVSTALGTDTEHAYFLELRSRISNDSDGKAQSDRGVPNWEGGVSLLYSDRQHSFGNTGAADHPGQTPVDAVPDPGNDTPNLADAAFTMARPTFDGCTHIDNYPDPSGPGGNWKLPNQLKFVVQAISGLTAGAAVPGAPASATVLAEVFPNCDAELAAPTLSVDGYEDPDTDAAYTLSWTRALNAVGPDTLQEATSCGPSFTDDAAEPLAAGGNTLWEGSEQWISQLNPGDGSESYYIPDGASQDESLTMVDAIAIPAGYSSTLTFTTTQGIEATYDFGYVEVSADGGEFKTMATYTGPAGLGATPLDVVEGTRTIDLSEFAGKAIKVRFRMESDAFNEGAPAGWWIDNISLTNSNWTNVVADTAATSHALTNHANGSYCYRVRTKFPVGAATVPSSWSNVVDVTVDAAVVVNVPPVANAGLDFPIDEGAATLLNGGGSSDPENGVLTYSWTQQSGPAVTLANANTAAPSFTAPLVDADTPLTFKLQVTDVGGLSHSDSVIVTVEDVPDGGGGTIPPPADTGEIGNSAVGGALPPLTLLMLGLLGALGLRRRYS